MAKGTTVLLIEHPDEEILLTTGNRPLCLAQLAGAINALQGGALGERTTAVRVEQVANSASLTALNMTKATGTVTLTGVGGTAASGTVTLGGGAGDVTIVTDGTSVGPVPFNTSDAQTATDCITALNANGTFAAKATAASGGSGVVLITWDTKGVVGNTKTLSATRTAGTATASGATLAGGVDGSVTVTVGGVAVTGDTTNLSDGDAAIAVEIAFASSTAAGRIVDVTSGGSDVLLEAVRPGTLGNLSLVATSATGTAVVSSATLTGGDDGTSILLERP